MRTKTRRQMVGLMVGVGLMGLIGCGGESYVASAQLKGDYVVPPVTTTASGYATAKLEGSSLKVEGSFSGLSSNQAEVSGSSVHVYQGATGASGGIVFGLTVTSTDQRSGTFSGTQNINASQQEAFRNSQLFLSVQTTNNPGGEIRGQLIPVKD
jgi:hypothetical protein